MSFVIAKSSVVGRLASFWVSAGVVAQTAWISAAPAMDYRLYAETWHLTHTTTTGIFAIYPVVIVAMLVGLADLSDFIGRRTTMIYGLTASLIGTLCFALAQAARSWRPQIPYLPPGTGRAFSIASIAMTTAYSHGVLVLSLGGQVAHDLVASPNSLVSAAILSLFALSAAAASVAAMNLEARTSIATGATASAASMGLLALALVYHRSPIFLAAMATAGVGYGLLFRGGLEVIDRAAPLEHRGGVLSAAYLLAYLSMGTLAVVLGEVGTEWGLAVAVDSGACIIGVSSFAAIVLAILLQAPFAIADVGCTRRMDIANQCRSI
jgi:hypothetical protein